MLNFYGNLVNVTVPLRRVWQSIPVNDEVQLQVKVPFWCGTQVPLFSHGREAQGSNARSHWAPDQPVWHVHVYVVPLACTNSTILIVIIIRATRLLPLHRRRKSIKNKIDKNKIDRSFLYTKSLSRGMTSFDGYKCYRASVILIWFVKAN